MSRSSTSHAPVSGERWLIAACAVVLLWLAAGLYMKHRDGWVIASARSELSRAAPASAPAR
jgi:hypothetical protein